MANSIDLGTLALGALVGIGCKKQLKTVGRVAATTAASLAGVAAQAAQQVANETSKSPEEAAAQQWTQRIDQKLAGTQPQTGAGTTQNGN